MLFDLPGDDFELARLEFRRFAREKQARVPEKTVFLGLNRF